jgi:transposase
VPDETPPGGVVVGCRTHVGRHGLQFDEPFDGDPRLVGSPAPQRPAPGPDRPDDRERGHSAVGLDEQDPALAEVGLALAGRAGARLADVFGARVSRNTVLRLVDALPEPQPQPPRVVGVDEYAMRKGRIYGTVLVDVETRRPVDLLPDREAGTVAAWLAEHPSIEVVCRDRAPFFAEGASIGAPTAVQVADRFHLWRNLGEAAEWCVSRHRLCLRATFAELAPEKTPAPKQAESGSPWPTGHRFADRTRAKHATVHALLAAGHSRRSIQRQLGMTYRTVQRLADAAQPEDLFQGQWQNRRTKLDDFKPYLHEQWSEGCTNAWTLWEGIKLRWLVHTGLSASIRRENACGRELLSLLLGDGSSAVIATR